MVSFSNPPASSRFLDMASMKAGIVPPRASQRAMQTSAMSTSSKGSPVLWNSRNSSVSLAFNQATTSTLFLESRVWQIGVLPSMAIFSGILSLTSFGITPPPLRVHDRDSRGRRADLSNAGLVQPVRVVTQDLPYLVRNVLGFDK